MIAVGARCDCGWGPLDKVELKDADKVLVNLAYMIRGHVVVCPLHFNRAAGTVANKEKLI